MKNAFEIASFQQENHVCNAFKQRASMGGLSAVAATTMKAINAPINKQQKVTILPFEGLGSF